MKKRHPQCKKYRAGKNNRVEKLKRKPVWGDNVGIDLDTDSKRSLGQASSKKVARGLTKEREALSFSWIGVTTATERKQRPGNHKPAFSII